MGIRDIIVRPLWKARLEQMCVPQTSHRVTLVDVLATFTIFPQDSYELIIPLRTKQTSTEAIASHWQAVGEHLSYAMTCQASHEKNETNDEK